MNNYPAMVYTLALTIPVSLVMMHQNTKVITVPKGLAVHKKKTHRKQNLQTFISDSNSFFFSEELKREKKKKDTQSNKLPSAKNDDSTTVF